MVFLPLHNHKTFKFPKIAQLEPISQVEHTHLKTLPSPIYIIKWVEDFLSTERADILTLKGFGEKTVDKITSIILEAEEDKQVNSINEENSELTADENSEDILEEVDSD